MIKSLHRRLALLLIASISVVLMLASGAALVVSERQLALREQAAFQGSLDALAQEVRMSSSVSSASLAKTEAQGHLVLTIYDSGQTISFRGGWQPATPRDALFERALLAAERAGVSLDSGTGERYLGELSGDLGERYLAAVQPIRGYRSQRAVVMLQDMRQQDGERVWQRAVYAVITLLAMAVMSVFGWLFTARAVRPIAQAHAQQNAFVAAASHEMRTPLQILQSNLDALKGDPDDPRRFTAAMQRELSRMGRLSEDLMLLTGAEGDTSSLFGPVELTDLIDEAMRDHLAAAAEKQIELRLAAPPATPPIEGDALMLRRAVNVLIDNAICYTQPGGQIEVSISTEQKRLLLCVEDDGPGIPPEHQPHIFERFYRADQSRTDRTHSGLGLSIAQQIAAHHGGQLRYHPIKPHGSRFCLILPLIPNP